MARSHDAKAETSGQIQSVAQFIFTHTYKNTLQMAKHHVHKNTVKQMSERNNHRKHAD